VLALGICLDLRKSKEKTMLKRFAMLALTIGLVLAVAGVFGAVALWGTKLAINSISHLDTFFGILALGIFAGLISR